MSNQSNLTLSQQTICTVQKKLYLSPNSRNAPYMHHTCTIHAPYMHHTCTIMYGAFWGICNILKYFWKCCLSRTNCSKLPCFLFFFKNCSSQFRNWLFFTYFCSMYKLYCVVRYTVLMYRIFMIWFVDLSVSYHSFSLRQ